MFSAGHGSSPEEASADHNLHQQSRRASGTTKFLRLAGIGTAGANAGRSRKFLLLFLKKKRLLA
jgi:hypothetical protein